MKCIRRLLLGRSHYAAEVGERVSNECLRKRWGIPTLKSVVNWLRRAELIRWKCLLSNDQDYVDDEIKNLEKEWERRMSIWRRNAAVQGRNTTGELSWRIS